MRHVNKIAVVLVGAALFMTGCAESIPDLSEEQNDMVAEYAAGLLLKYDKNYDGALPVIEEDAAETETEEALPENEQPTNIEETETTEAENVLPEAEEAPVENVVTDIANFLELSGVSVDYTGYELTASYIEGEDIVFSLDATPGNQLLIVNFDITNTQAEDIEVDILNKKDVRFKLGINGGAGKNVLYTMLTNDFSVYKNTIAAGTTEKAVLICEIKEEDAAVVENVSLYMRNGENSVTMTLE